MVAGFTGTRRGMTHAQKGRLGQLLRMLKVRELHHGDCVGADAEANEICLRMGIRTVSHPPSESALRAFCRVQRSYSPVGYLERNKAIVDAAGVLLACPVGAVEVQRSGTWSTVRYARRQARTREFSCMVINPNGTVVQ